MKRALTLVLVLAATWCPARGGNVGFIETDGLRFVLNGQTYYYVGTNLWYGLNLASAGAGGDRDRLHRELDNLASLGVTNLRVMAGSEGPNTEPWRMIPSLQTDPGTYDPDVLDGLDYLLKAMDDRELRAVMCLTNFWHWSGGFAQYVSWNGGGPIPYPPPEPGGDWNVFQDYSSDFHSNAGAKQDYLDHAAFLINRINPYTGVAYKDDPTIMAWELANEPRGFHNNAVAFNQWIDDAAAYIKSLDSNHLVTTGCEGDTPWPDWHGLDFVTNHDGPNIDYATIAIWPQGWFSYDPTNPEGTYAAAEAASRSYFNDHEALAAGTLGKPLALEEFGLSRDGGSYDPASTTVWRDMFFAAMYEEVYASASAGGPAAGEHFTAWAGEGRPVPPYGGYWAPGDPWTGDPPHTEQGLYGVYDADSTTLAAVSSHAVAMAALNPAISDVQIGNVTLSHTDDYIKDGDTAVVTATVTDNDPSFGASHITADLTGLGGGPAVNPTSYDGATATWNVGPVGCVPSDGTVTVTVDATDPIGNPAAPGSDTITADNTPPEPVTGFLAVSRYEMCELIWVEPTDNFAFAGVSVISLNDEEYPTYPAFRGDWPDVSGHYPADHTDGREVYSGPGTSCEDAVVPRDIYFYRAFGYDEARNYGSAGPTSGDFATNYWLGDVANGWLSWGYDGSVDPNDVEFLSHTYGTAPAGSYLECDVGPTVNPDDSRLGVPLPDGLLDFEDLMIFAMNYGIVSARVIPCLPEPVPGSELALAIEKRSESESGAIEFSLVLAGNVDEVKGLSGVVSYDTSELVFLSARLSDTATPYVGDVFFWHDCRDGEVHLDLAALGTGVTLGGSGEIAVLSFTALSPGYSVEFERAELRGVGNRELQAKSAGYVWRHDVPAEFGLAQNVPNPFNPVTRIAYGVPRACTVSIQVHDLEGRLIRTLVDEPVEPGQYVAVWNGRNESGQAVGSGVYFCTMQEGDTRITRKMLLLK
jgi:mannan endo-1,4-beta-mannosidase